MRAREQLKPATTLSEMVAEEVRAWAARRGMNQARLAAVLGVSQAQISARMRGQMPFRLDEMERLAQAFGIEPRELIPSSDRRPVTVTAVTSDDQGSSVTGRYSLVSLRTPHVAGRVHRETCSAERPNLITRWHRGVSTCDRLAA